MNTRLICRCGLLVALLAASSQIAIAVPFASAPISLSVLMVLICGAFGTKTAVISILAYVLLGAAGLPVFSSFRGLSALISPNGGYIIGYIPAAFISSLAFKYQKSPIQIFLGLACGIASCHLCGTAFFSVYTSTSFVDSLFICSVPFIPIDLLKAVLALIVGIRLKRILSRQS